jgi:hypothetical protein
MAGNPQDKPRYPDGFLRQAAIAFGGGIEGIVKRDYRPGTKTLLRAGERVRIVTATGGKPKDEPGGMIYAYRKGAVYGRKIPRSYVEVHGTETL